MQAKVIVLEGIDDVGKSTLSVALTAALNNSGRSAISFSFPGKEGIGGYIYGIYAGHNLPCSSSAMQAMHIASHIDIVERLILPASENYDFIILDRSYWSTYAYGIAQGVSKKVIDSLVDAELECWEHLRPTVLFLVTREIDMDPVALQVQNVYEFLLSKLQWPYPIEQIYNSGTVDETIAKLLETEWLH